ncbi:hypothetical protein [Micromonospora craterilacus]|uniref:hypothetical protein n=1 Tax=Micromonospora craterilacus TaxID=1655439 RepID=UPI001313E802
MNQGLNSRDAGRLDDEGLIIGTGLAGWATRPLRVQTGHPHLVEPVDNLPDRVLVGFGRVAAGQGRRRRRVGAIELRGPPVRCLAHEQDSCRDQYLIPASNQENNEARREPMTTRSLCWGGDYGAVLSGGASRCASEGVTVNHNGDAIELQTVLTDTEVVAELQKQGPVHRATLSLSE